MPESEKKEKPSQIARIRASPKDQYIPNKKAQRVALEKAENSEKSKRK